MINRNQIEALRSRYPVGSRVELHYMNDPYSPVESGTWGTIVAIDDAGQLHTKWDNGRTLALIPGEDRFTVYPVRNTSQHKRRAIQDR